MPLHIHSRDADIIRRAGEESFPHECCGFLLGEAADRNRRVDRIVCAENARRGTDRRRRYSIKPEDFMAVEKAARGEGMAVVGFYHSHPDAPAEPSAYDREHAWPRYSYVIVSVKGGQAAEMTSWVLRDDRATFDEEQLTVDDRGTPACP